MKVLLESFAAHPWRLRAAILVVSLLLSALGIPAWAEMEGP